MSMKENHGEVYWRFNAFHRLIHLVMMITFVGLALTGLPLKYPGAFWAKGLISLWGGVKGAGMLHRWCAGITFGYFTLHLLWILYCLLILKEKLFGPDSIIPSRKDFQDLYQHIRYFLGKGSPPPFGRFTYWEKFDYWAVFWGIAFIGGSGLLLWFPEFFSRFLPGLWFNIAYTIHSDEALLAIGFIFVVHLYNAHLRAHVFPMDKSIFTGKITAKEMIDRHPLEWEYLNRYPEKKAKRKVRRDLLILWLAIFISGLLPAGSLARGLTDEEIMEVEKKWCWRCHRQPNLNSNEGITASIQLCMDCHGKKEVEKKVNDKPVSLYIDPKEYGKTVHRRIACIQCHDGIASSPHRTLRFRCASCHGYHGEGTAHDAHRTVHCEACHHESKEVMKDPKTGKIVLLKGKEGVPIPMTSHRLADFKNQKACQKCHFTENQLGAPIRVLPAKSLICIICHSASITLRDPISLIAFILFLGGITLHLSLWFRGTVGTPSFSAHEKVSYLAEKIWRVVFSKKIFTLLKVFLIDVLFLRGILKESLSRWTIHTFIYLPFFLRFFIGLILLILSKVFPMSSTVAILLDKNYAPMAFTYDLLGLCVIIGVGGATMRRLQKTFQNRPSSSQDMIVLALLGGILITGFIVEGLRLLLTGIPPSLAISSFVGYPISLFLGILPVRWEWVYPYGWYVHAILTGLFIIYLPFSKMFHILISPLVLLINSVTEEK
ncbi:MAG: cytochrome b/b6 domain-containing protein [Syntrophaceae bacterium]|nr:cytochrome b/b6 domain-containing protein [Syntrophaceae bacterium]